MLSLRNRFGIPGVISVIALVFAMLGGAYAASNNGGGKATASAKAKKGPRGPKGATGPAGPAGAQGPTGANGKDGANGSNGSAGIQGSQGLPGKSVAVANYSGPECPGSEEGATVEVAGEPSTKKYVCDGAEGTQGSQGIQGIQGSPWTAGGTLPKGSTLTGVWNGNLGAEGVASVPVSFALPLVNVPEGVLVAPGGDGSGEGCPGVTGGIPKAAEGKLCLYQGIGPAFENGSPTAFIFGSPTNVGAVAAIACEGSCSWKGVWAVTAG